MIWHLGSPLAEQRAMVDGRGVVVFPDRAVLQITGPERQSWLHNLTSRNFINDEPGTAKTALILDHTGRILFVLHTVEAGDSILAWTESGLGEGLVEWLTKMRFMTQVEVLPRDDLQVLWVGSAEEALAGEIASYPSEIVSGREVFVPRALELTPSAGDWAYTALRIAAGIPQLSVDTDALTIPNELGFYATDWGKGCYPGQETVAHVHNLGRIPRRLVRLNLDGAEERLPELGSKIMLDDAPVGTITSAAYHYELGPIGLALIKRATPVDSVLVVDSIPATQDVLVDPELGEHFKAPGLRRLL